MCLREGSRDSRSLPILVEKIETLQCGVEQLIFFFKLVGKIEKVKTNRTSVKTVEKNLRNKQFFKMYVKKIEKSKFIRKVETCLNWDEQSRTTFLLCRENRN